MNHPPIKDPSSTLTNGSSPTVDAPSPQETRDTLFRGAVTLWQRTRGHRFAIDTLVLAGGLRVDENARVLDLGCGNGALALAVAHLHHPAQVMGIEIQPSLLELATRNLAENHLESVIQVTLGDVRAIETIIAPQSFDAVVCNPPYHPCRSGRLNPDRERAAARHELHGTLLDFVRAAQFSLVPRGTFLTVLPAFRLPDVLSTMRSVRLTPSWIQLVYPRPDESATLVLVQGYKGGSKRLVVRPPLWIRIGDDYSGPVKTLLDGTRPTYPGEELAS